MTEDFFVVDAGFVNVGAPVPRVPGALPLACDADAGTDFGTADADDTEDDAFEGIVTEEDFAAVDSPDAAGLAAEDGFVVEDDFVTEEGLIAEESCVVEEEYVAQTAFVPEAEFGPDGTCAGEACVIDEDSLTV